MANVSLRFHGRFLYAEQTFAKKLIVVAPVFDEAAFGKHQPLMSIRHDQVIFKAKDHQTVITTFEPSFRILSDVTAKDPQVLVWDLTGCRVTYETAGANDGRLSPAGSVVASLKDLEDNEGRRAELNSDALDLKKPFANTLIEVTSPGVTKSAHSIDYFFTHEDKVNYPGGKPEAVKKKGSQDPLKKRPSEIVEFAVPVPTPPPGEAPRLILKFKRKDGSDAGQVCVEAGGVVCFAHNCPKIQELPTTDLEFMRYYDALKDHHVKALIPFEDESGLIEGIPCYQQSQMSF